MGLVISFLAETGLRVSELVSIDIQDGALIGNAYHVTVLGKGEKQRTVFCTVELWHRIRKQFGGRWGPLFRTSNDTRYSRKFIYRKIVGYSEATGRRISPHCLRHSLATRLIADGVDLHAVSDYLGHSSEAVTADMYAHTQIATDQIPQFSAESRGQTTRGRKRKPKALPP